MSKRPKSTAAAPAPASAPARSAAAPPPIDQRPAEAVVAAHRDPVSAGVEEARRGLFAPDEMIEALFRKAAS